MVNVPSAPNCWTCCDSAAFGEPGDDANVDEAAAGPPPSAVDADPPAPEEDTDLARKGGRFSRPPPPTVLIEIDHGFVAMVAGASWPSLSSLDDGMHHKTKGTSCLFPRL